MRVFITIAILLCLSTIAFSDIIYLKDGGTVKGEIIKGGGESVKVKTGIGVVTVERGNIEKIVKAKPKKDKLPGYVITEEQTDNAATYYTKAASLMVYPDSQKEIVEEIIKNGWQEENNELEKILSDNKPCFTDMEKGLLLRECDFSFGKGHSFLAKEATPAKELKLLSNLLLLRGMYYEKNEDFHKAVDDYCSILHFARHMSQNKSLISRILGIYIEEQVYLPLKSYVTLPDADKELCKKIALAIETHESKRISLKDIIENEKESYISVVRRFVSDLERGTETLPNLTDEERKNMSACASKLVERARPIGNRYYGNFIKAAESGGVEDRNFAISEIEKLYEESKQLIPSDPNKFSNFMFEYAIENTDESSNKLLLFWLTLTFPNFDKIFDKYYKAINNLKEIKSIIEAKVEKS